MPRFRPMPTVFSINWARTAGGLTLYIDDGILCYEYNLFIIQRTKVRSSKKLPSGKVRIELRQCTRNLDRLVRSM